MVDVVRFGDALLAIGTGSTRTAVWTLSESSEWQETKTVGLDRIVDGFVSVDALAANPDVVVALGTDVREPPSSPVVWRSLDGIDWKMVDSAAFATDQNQSLEDVVWTGSRFVATGTESRTTSPASSAVVILLSLDGATWVRVRDPNLENPDLSHPTAIAASAEKVIVAAIGPTVTTLYQSDDDGDTWTQSRPGAFRSSVIEGLMVSSLGDVAVGCELDQLGAEPDHATAWLGVGGLDGELTEAVMDDSGEPSCASDVIESETGLTAVGYVGSAQAIWTSSDGMEWVRVGAGNTIEGWLSAAATNATIDVAVGTTRPYRALPVGVAAPVSWSWAN